MGEKKMLNTAKEIDNYSKEISQNYQYLESQKQILEQKVEDGLLTQEQASIQYSNALDTLKEMQRDKARELQDKLQNALTAEIVSIQKSYKTVTQDNKAELDLLALAGNAEELERAVARYENTPLALLRLQQISKERDTLLMIDVYPKERRLFEYSKQAKRLIEDIASRTNTTVTGKAKINFMQAHDDAQKAYNAYKYPSQIIG